MDNRRHTVKYNTIQHNTMQYNTKPRLLNLNGLRFEILLRSFSVRYRICAGFCKILRFDTSARMRGVVTVRFSRGSTGYLFPVAASISYLVPVNLSF